MKRMLITLLCLLLCCAPALASETEIRYLSEAETAYAVPEREHKVRFRNFDGDMLRDVLFGGKDIDLTDGGAYDPQEGRYAYNGDADEHALAVSMPYLLYQHKDLSYSNLRYLRDLMHETPTYAPKEVAGVTEAQALMRVREFAAGLGLATGDTIQITAVNDTAFQRLYRTYYQREVDFAVKRGFDPGRLNIPVPEGMSAMPEGYWIRMALCMDGIPVIREIYDYKASGRNVYGSTLAAYVMRTGVEYFFAEDIYEIIESRALSGEIMPLDKAKGLLEKKYKNLIMSKPVEVERIGLEYVPIPIESAEDDFILRPAWCFYLVGLGVTYDALGENTPVYFDAVTGKELS